MEAKDTVMGKVQRDNIFYRGIGTLEGVCQMQAEISFKAGMVKVVEFANHFAGIKHNPRWTNKLNEWGLSE